MLCDFKQRHAQAPDVTSDGVALASNPFRGHVITGPDECVGIALSTELSTHAKVAELHPSFSR